MFTTGLICFLAGAFAAALYANHHVDRREIASFHRGRQFERDMLIAKHRERGKKAAATRRSKA